MKMSDYQNAASMFAGYNEVSEGKNFEYLIFKLMEEVGEFVATFAKLAFIGKVTKQSLTEEQLDHIHKEAGDILWFLSQILMELGINMDSVAFDNIIKLKRRQAAGTINKLVRETSQNAT